MVMIGQIPCFVTPCDFCVDSPHNCKHDCKGIACEKRDSCHRKLSAIVRITTKCTQSCAHCCFACSPDCNDMMSLTTAKMVHKFLINNKFSRVNIMGGEFFCNRYWASIIAILCEGMDVIRITTNGDWGNNTIIQQKLLVLAQRFPIMVAISNDKYHTNAFVREASAFCQANHIPFQLGKGEVNNDEAIVPVKRGWLFAGTTSCFSKYCNIPSHRYTVMIDEKGYIAKCPLRIWKYDHVSEYIETPATEYYDRFKHVFQCFCTTITCADCTLIFAKIGIEFEKNCV